MTRRRFCSPCRALQPRPGFIWEFKAPQCYPKQPENNKTLKVALLLWKGYLNNSLSPNSHLLLIVYTNKLGFVVIFCSIRFDSFYQSLSDSSGTKIALTSVLGWFFSSPSYHVILIFITFASPLWIAIKRFSKHQKSKGTSGSRFVFLFQPRTLWDFFPARDWKSRKPLFAVCLVFFYLFPFAAFHVIVYVIFRAFFFSITYVETTFPNQKSPQRLDHPKSRMADLSRGWNVWRALSSIGWALQILNFAPLMQVVRITPHW